MLVRSKGTPSERPALTDSCSAELQNVQVSDPDKSGQATKEAQ
jgi:hypothetical protein